MGTRAQAFTAKIKNLQELQFRLISGSVPQPQGHEVANSLKYFSATLLGVLRYVIAIASNIIQMCFFHKGAFKYHIIKILAF